MGLVKVTDKTLDDFKDLEPKLDIRLDKYDRDVNNNKFWWAQVYELGDYTYLVRRWGRNGTKGQFQIERGWNAIAVARDLERKKRKEGYGNDPSLLEKMARELAD